MYFVRLECVMHAASVNPEPGSNSRNICILSDRRRSVKIYSELDCSFFTFFRVVFSFRIARCSFALACFILISYCSIFKDHSPSPFRDSLIIISHHLHLVNTFFQFFLCFLSFSQKHQTPCPFCRVLLKYCTITLNARTCMRG